jgi:type I restriction enzyme, S subunit
MASISVWFRIATAFPSNVDKKSYDGEPHVLLCNYTDVYYNDEILSDMQFMAATATPEQIDKFTLRAGDTIITKDSETPDEIAIAAYVPHDLPGVVCGYHLSVIVRTHVYTGASSSGSSTLTSPEPGWARPRTA